jgi:hypothetical protein
MIIDLKQSSAFEEVFASDNSRAPPESEKQIFRRYLTVPALAWTARRCAATIGVDRSADRGNP